MKPWVKLPSKFVLDDRLKELLWTHDKIGKPSHKVAGLKLYIALSMLAKQEERYSDLVESYISSYSAQATYQELAELTALSRASIAAGIEVLVTLQLLTVRLDGRKNIYVFPGFNGSGDWCKMPCRALLSRDGKRIEAFYKLKLRSKIELYALKMFIYICAVRDNSSSYTSASFEKINMKTSIPESDIPRTHAYLSGIGLIALVEKRREGVGNTKKNPPNAYYVTGYNDLFVGKR
ncbi:ArsR family transcriptional regulator [Kosakonia sacchari]|uniref:ArsR family transcriptional regulator n=1 Tax=Kosakonia sacchari TaxID=1158459 RepID=UPI0015857D8D|nr:ArsR family transcriptional regulator [Kosakonia sacchari]NUL39722.1 ArsR family transcriptional regulator [Kosakonia sacchari]